MILNQMERESLAKKERWSGEDEGSTSNTLSKDTPHSVLQALTVLVLHHSRVKHLLALFIYKQKHSPMINTFTNQKENEMPKWIKIYSDREWKNTRIIDEEKILQLSIYETIEEIEIVYPGGIFTKTFMIKKAKDSEYNYLENLGKQV